MSRQEGIDAYQNTVARLEPDITPIDLTGAAASVAISLKRIADTLERMQPVLDILLPLIEEAKKEMEAERKSR